MLLTTAWVCLIVLVATFAAWRRYLWVRTTCERDAPDSCAFSLTDRFSDHHLKNVPHQDGVRWLHEVFERSARRFPQNEALHVPNTGQRLTYEALDRRAEQVAGALTRHVTGPDQVVVVAMDQDDWHIVAAHLGILKCGAVTLFLDSRLPDALVERMLADAAPVAMLTRGEPGLRGIPVIDVLNLEHAAVRRVVPAWLEDPARSLATLFYTSGTTGMPKGVECHHAGYVNLALTYADYFDLVPGMDATSLTSSLGYDGSISEMYGAWVSGCSVVLLTGEEVRSGPDLLPILRAAEVTVLFCPPALLPTLTSSPATDLPYPLCRYIVPAGEAFPEALVEPWTRGRRQVINTYGPTEASTDTSRQSLRPGEPVTIGSPFPNVTYVILPFGGMAPLPHGEAGELCIGGVHLAHGYRNQPEQTAEKFIDHPRFGRLYRTGDKCRIDIHSQRVEFLGREDVQIKVRGHRVEIQPIEDLLQSQFSEIDAAVVDYQNEELIAFVAASSMLQGDDPECLPAPPQWNARVLDRLAGQLPAIAVPSRLFLVRKFALQALSGKIDRRQLPLVTAVVEDSGIDNRKGSRDTPALAGMIADDGTVLQICRDVFATDLGWDDVFADHGGHSIVIARLAQRLQADGWKVTVRDLLSDLDTARKIAEQAERPALAVDSSQKAPPGQAGPVVGDAAMRQVLGVKWFTTLQCLLILLIYAPAVMGIILVTVAVEWDQFLTTASLLEFVALGILGYLLTLCLPFVNLIWVMLLKFVTGGHPREYHIAPGIYPKWSRMHLRLWFVGRLQTLVLSPTRVLFRSAPVTRFVLRGLGARIGSNLQAASDVNFFGPLELLSIGHDVTIQSAALVSTAQWAGQLLQIGPVRLEDECKIGMRAAVSPDVKVGRGTWVTPFTPMLNTTGPGEMWDGAPARCTGGYHRLRRLSESLGEVRHPWLMETLNLSLQAAFESLLVVIPVGAVAWFVHALTPLTGVTAFSGPVTTHAIAALCVEIGLYGIVTTWLSIFLVSLLTCLFLRLTRSAPGIYASRGLRGLLLLYRVKKMNQVQRIWGWSIIGQYLRALSGMRFTHIGASECDVMHNLVPESVGASSNVFWSHGCMTNLLDHDADYLKLGQIEMPVDFFAGNGSVTDAGQYPSHFLLGVVTPGDDIRFRRQMRTRFTAPMAVAGNPPLKFAVPVAGDTSDSADLPSLGLFLLRFCLFDLIKVGVLPTAEIICYALVFLVLHLLGFGVVAAAALALVGTELWLLLLCLMTKRVLVGRWGEDATTSFWSVQHFSYFFSQDCFFGWCSNSLSLFAGTLLPNLFLRRMGCRIGRRTIITSPLQAFDWNAIDLGDDCVADGLFQLHTFEGMMLKVKRARIGNGCCLSQGTCVMGGASIESGSSLLPLSLVLKDMQLRTACYEGSPVGAIHG